MEDMFAELFNDLLSLIENDIGWLFLAFYGFMAIICAIMLWLATSEKGLFRHMAFACVMLCIFFSGLVACLAILDLKQPRTIISKTEVIREGGSGRLTAGPRLESLGPKEPPEVKEIVIDPYRAYVRPFSGYDEEGNLIEDNLSHEDGYPEYSN